MSALWAGVGAALAAVLDRADREPAWIGTPEFWGAVRAVREHAAAVCEVEEERDQAVLRRHAAAGRPWPLRASVPPSAGHSVAAPRAIGCLAAGRRREGRIR